MKIFIKKSFVLTLLIVGFFSFINYANAQTRPTVPPLVPDSATGCTGYENEARCRPEWADSVSRCQVGTLNLGGANTCVTTDLAVKEVAPYVVVCSSSFQLDGCQPHKVNIYAAKNLANQAEIMGRSLGYTISCNTQTLGMAGYINPANNLTYGLFTSCTVNGHSGFDAYTLVNDPARNSSYTNWDVLATELKSIAATTACGIYKVVSWNSNGTYQCVASPHYTDTCVGAENASKFNYVTGKSCAVSNTSTTPPACGITATCGGSQVVIPNTNITNTTPATTNLTPPPSNTYNNNWYYKDLSYSSVDEENQLTSTETIDPTTECTGYETTANCHPEWNRTTSVCNASKMTGPCRPERVNPYAAANIAKRAVAIGKQKGYATLCSARYVPFRPGIDPDTGLTYYYDIECSVNGTTGIDAEIMLSNSNWEAQVGKPSTTGTNTIGTITSTPATNTTNTQTITNSTRPSCSLTATCGTNNNTQNTSASLTFRYLKLDTTEDGWVSWREIEAYGQNGVAVKPVSSKASCTWCGYGATNEVKNPQVDVAPSNTYDGGVHTSWNAGETGEKCNWQVPGSNGQLGCHGSYERKAWIQLDYGSVQTFSKIRAMQNGNTITEVTRVLVSNDGINFKELTTFKAPMGDMEWVQYPLFIHPGPPSISVSLKGPGYSETESTTISPMLSESFLFSYSTKNTDYVTVEQENVINKNNCTTNWEIMRGFLSLKNTYLETQVKDKMYAESSCVVDVTTKLIAHQRTGKTASASFQVITKLQNQADYNSSFSYFVRNQDSPSVPSVLAGGVVNYRIDFFFARPSATNNIGTLENPIWTFPPLDIPVMKVLSAPSLFKITFDPITVEPSQIYNTRSERGTSQVKIEVPSTTLPGFYPIEFEGKTSSGNTYITNIILEVK